MNMMNRINGKHRKLAAAKDAAPAPAPHRDNAADDGPAAVDHFDLGTGVPDTFRVRDESSANWVVRKVRECRDYAQRVAAWAAAEVRGAEAEERWLMERFGCQLEEWVRQHLKRSGGARGRTRSVQQPAGTVGFRSESPRLVVVDDAKVLAWCRAHLPDALKAVAESEGDAARRLAAWGRTQCRAVRLRESFSKAALNAHAAATGELPDGAEVAPAGEKFYVK